MCGTQSTCDVSVVHPESHFVGKMVEVDSGSQIVIGLGEQEASHNHWQTLADGLVEQSPNHSLQQAKSSVRAFPPSMVTGKVRSSTDRKSVV